MTAMIHDRSPGTGLAQHDPQAAATLLHLLDGSIGGVHLFCVVAALLPEAIAGVLTVAVLYLLLARRLGTVAAFAGALARVDPARAGR